MTEPSSVLENAPVPQAIVHMAVPMMASMVLDLVYNLVNAIFIGQLNDTALLAALTLAFPVPIVLMGVGQIFGIGGGTLISRLLGEKDAVGARRASAVTIYLSLGSGVVLAALCLPFLDPLVSFLGARGDAWEPTRDMVAVLVLGSPFLIATVTLAETLRAEGAARASMAGMAASVAVNVALDPLFLFVFRWGVGGAALATVLANAAAVGFFLWYLRFRSPVQSVRLRDFRPDRPMLASLFSVGSSALVFSVLMVVASLVFNTLSMAYGQEAVAAFGVANRLAQIVEFLGAGLFAGIVPLIAYAYGAGNYRRLNQILSTAIGWFLIATVVLGLALLLLRGPVFGWFTADPGVARLGSVLLTAMLVSALFGGLTAVATDVFQALGAGVQANALALARGLALVPLLVLGNLWFGWEGLVWALPAAEFLACALGAALWLGSRRVLLVQPA